MRIRRATDADIPQIEALLYQVHSVHSDKRPDLFIPGMKKYTAQDLKALLKDDVTPVFVAEDVSMGKILGHAFCVYKWQKGYGVVELKSMYIDDICVSEDVRRQNVGTKLYEYVIEEARRAGCYNVTLNVWEGNEPAKHFYESLGMKIQKYAMETIL